MYTRDQSCSISAAVPFVAPLLSAAAALAVLLSAAGALLVGDLTSFHVDIIAWMRPSWSSEENRSSSSSMI